MTGNASRTVRAVILAAAVMALVGCATTGQADSGIDPPTPRPTQSPAAPVPTDWDRVSESGTGPTVLTIPRPSPDAIYLMVQFTCSSGPSMVELQEDTTVFMGGPCGGSSAYQMPLPEGESELHFSIDIDPAAEFTFTGTFMPGSK
jgi:hypothetical protein